MNRPGDTPQPFYIESLALRDFRNYREAYVEFAPGINGIYGANAQGKSNLLEALFLFATGRSFRAKQLSELLRHNSERFLLELSFIKRGYRHELHMHCDGQQRRIIHNGKALRSLQDLLGLCPGVFTGPDDSELIKGPPSVRRYYLDVQLSQSDPRYLQHLARYQRALKQRNTLLRQKVSATLEAWEQQLAVSGAYIASQRALAVEDLNRRCVQLHGRLSQHTGDLALVYKGAVGTAEDLLDSYARQRSRDMLLGRTSVGPHRDEVEIELEGCPARSFASEGQQRTIVAALRLGEWQRLKERCMECPVIYMDDVANSLDSSRRALLFEALAESGQVFLSAPEALHIDGEQQRMFEVCAGAIVELTAQASSAGSHIQ